MVAWFKHDIPAWMDGTEALDDGPYRAYHVICQLIYLNEGPIALNEHGIAGRCKQSIRTFRAALGVLVELGKLTIEEGRIDNSRAKKELENVSENRVNAGKGGVKSGEVRKSQSKSLKNNDLIEASLPDDPSLKTREDETREEKIPRAPALVFETDWPSDYRDQFWQAFPKRVDKQLAFKRLEQLRKGGKLAWMTLFEGVKRYADSERGKDPTFTKGPAAWLNAGKWDDEVRGAKTFDIRSSMI